MDFDAYLGTAVGQRARELLEDFDVIATIRHMVLVPRNESAQHLRENVQAALVASTLGLGSLDYARRRYCKSMNSKDEKESPALRAYIETYICVKAYVQKMLKKLRTENRPDPSLGVFGSSLVLERLPSSFFCAHFLYRMGHKYEGHAISRLILEQIAWAFAACNTDDLDVIENIEATRAVTRLKGLIDTAGRLYGFLSTKTHIRYESHFEFLKVENGRNVVLHAQPDFLEYAHVLLHLADLFGIVWEISQRNYLDNFEAIRIENDKISLQLDRSFLSDIREHLKSIQTNLSEQEIESELP